MTRSKSLLVEDTKLSATDRKKLHQNNQHQSRIVQDMNFPAPPNANDTNHSNNNPPQLQPQPQSQQQQPQQQQRPQFASGLHQQQQQQQQHHIPNSQQQPGHSPQGGQQSFQHPQSQLPPQQLQHHHQHAMMNGVNGAGIGGGMPVPTPAGHQAELNYIYGMVEELSRQLAENRRVTEDIVSGLGRVRSRARAQGLTNEQVIDAAAEDLNTQQHNIDTLISVLTEALEKAKFSRDANATLLSQYANALAVMLKQFHEYKNKHVNDVAAWHRSYRKQLAEAREENSRLREQIWQMQAHAGQANENLRQFRRKYDDNEARWDRRVDEKAIRQELRFWKRMAMPELEDDDPFWSDDDDVIDPAEKIRLHELELKAVQDQLADSQAEDSDGQLPHIDMMDGIAMQREDSAGHGMMQVPAPPPRPLSAASSTGSTGQ